LPRRAQPVPPIFQPELAAEAIVHASHHPRREIWLGWPTVQAIVGDKFIPGLLDHYLARMGYEAQQFDGPEDPNRADNLWEPVPGDHGAKGNFNNRAQSWSSQWWARKNSAWLALAAIVLFGAACVQLATRHE